MIRNFSKFISPLLILAFVLCLASGASARIADTATMKMVNDSGEAVTGAIQQGETYYIIGEGLVPDTYYTIRRGYESGESDGTAIAAYTNKLFGGLKSPAVGKNQVYVDNTTGNVKTDANGFFVATYVVENIPNDDSAALTFSLHTKYAESTTPVAQFGPLTFTPTIKLFKRFSSDSWDSTEYIATTNITNANAKANLTDTYLVEVTSGFVSNLAGSSPTDDITDDAYPYVILISGFSKDAEYSDLQFTIDDDDVSLYSSGSYSDDASGDQYAENYPVRYFRIPKVTGGTKTIAVTDGTSTASLSFTVNPRIFVEYSQSTNVKAAQDTTKLPLSVADGQATGNPFQGGLTAVSVISTSNTATHFVLGDPQAYPGYIAVYGGADGTSYKTLTNTKYIFISGVGFPSKRDIKTIKIGTVTYNNFDIATDEDGTFGLSADKNPIVILTTGKDINGDALGSVGTGPKSVTIDNNVFDNTIMFANKSTAVVARATLDKSSAKVGDKIRVYYYDFNDPTGDSNLSSGIGTSALSLSIFKNDLSAPVYVDVDDSPVADSHQLGIYKATSPTTRDSGLDVITGLDTKFTATSSYMPFQGGTFSFVVTNVPNTFENGVPKPLYVVIQGVDKVASVGSGYREIPITINPSITDLSSYTYVNGETSATIEVKGFEASKDIKVYLDDASITTKTTMNDSVHASTTDRTTTVYGYAKFTFPIGDGAYGSSNSTRLAAGTHTLKVKTDTTGCEVSTTFTVKPKATFDSGVALYSGTVYDKDKLYKRTMTVSKLSYQTYFAPVTASAAGKIAQSVSNETNGNAINGASLYLDNKSSKNFKASTPYLFLLDNPWDATNVKVLGSFTTGPYGVVPLNTKYTLPMTLLPGTHVFNVAEDVDADGMFTKGTDTIVWSGYVLDYSSFTNTGTATDRNKTENLNIFASVTADTTKASPGQTVTVKGYGLKPENYPTDTNVNLFKLLYDNNGVSEVGALGDATSGADDDVLLLESITANVDGQITESFTMPTITGTSTHDMFIVESDDLKTVPSVIKEDGATVDTYYGAAGYNISSKKSVTLSSYVGQPGDSIVITGSGFDPYTSYTMLFGGAGAGNTPPGSALIDFTTNAEGDIPAGTTFIVPLANNSTFGVVISPTPASNLIDVVKTTAATSSVLDLADRPTFIVGGTLTELNSATSAGPTSVTVKFSGSLNAGSAQQISHYSISTLTGEGLPVSGATASGDTVTLTTSAQAGVEYTLNVSGVIDIYGNQISGTATFTGTETGIAVNPAALNLVMGGEAKSFTASLEGYTDGFAATTGDANVATVAAGTDANSFVVTPVGVGTTTITVSDDPNAEYSATVTVTVAEEGTPTTVDPPKEPISDGGNGKNLSDDNTGALFSPGTIVDGKLTGNIQYSVNFPEYTSPVDIWILIFGPGEEGVSFGTANFVKADGTLMEDDGATYPKYASNQTGPFQGTVGEAFDPCTLAGDEGKNVRYGIYYLIVDTASIADIDGNAAQLLSILGTGMNAQLEYMWFDAQCGK